MNTETVRARRDPKLPLSDALAIVSIASLRSYAQTKIFFSEAQIVSKECA